MIHQTGGLRWKQGSDACIFKPSVQCKGQGPNPANTISKIIPKGSLDERVETVIQTHFPHVVAGKGVLIAQKRCTPEFSAQNENVDSNIEDSCKSPLPPCFRTKFLSPENYTNFVVEEYDTSYHYESYSLSLSKKIKLLKRPINAAVAMVPDEGPWVIGLDFHANNIFVKDGAEKIVSLADWGRMLVIENPNDLASVQKGLKECYDNLKKSDLVNNTFASYACNYDSYGNEILKEYNMFPIFVRRAFDRLLALPAGSALTDDIHIVRMQSVYGILKSCIDPPLSSLLSELTHTISQKEIIDTIQDYIPLYINLNAFFPPIAAPPPEPAKPNYRLLGFGGKRTRKQQKSLKKKVFQKIRRFGKQRSHTFRKN